MAGFVGVLAITMIALSIIGLMASPSGPFNAIFQTGWIARAGALLGVSLFALILDLVWVGILCKKTKEPSVLQKRPSELDFPVSKSPQLKADSPPLVFEGKEEFNEEDFFYSPKTPNEVIIMILGHLPPSQQMKCGKVNKRFFKLSCTSDLLNTFNPRVISDSVEVFNEESWASCVDMEDLGLSTDDVSMENVRNTNIILERVLTSSIMEEIEEGAGVTLLTIPKGLTFNTFLTIADKLKLRNVSLFKAKQFANTVQNKLIIDTPVEKTYRIVITNSVFKNSRNTPFSNQKILVSSLGCEIPKVKELIALLFATFMSTGKYIYGGLPAPILSRCQESDELGLQWAVGCFESHGIAVAKSSVTNHMFGVGGTWRNF